MRRPNDPDPDSAGDHAAERLREFLEKRKPQEARTPNADIPASRKPASPAKPRSKKSSRK